MAPDSLHEISSFSDRTVTRGRAEDMQVIPSQDGLSLEDGDGIILRFIHRVAGFTAEQFFIDSGGEFVRDEAFFEILDDDCK